MSSGQKCKAGVVLNRTLGQLAGGLAGQLDIHFVANVVMVVPNSSFTSPMKSMRVCSAPPCRPPAARRLFRQLSGSAKKLESHRNDDQVSDLFGLIEATSNSREAR